jgi:hypothetical protein
MNADKQADITRGEVNTSNIEMNLAISLKILIS